jgi:hypothetical protein
MVCFYFFERNKRAYNHTGSGQAVNNNKSRLNSKGETTPKWVMVGMTNKYMAGMASSFNFGIAVFKEDGP